MTEGLGPNVENEMTVMDNEDPADPSVHEPRVTDAPETVWLVYGDLERDATHRECCDSGEVTWCEDAQFAADVRYLRADLLYHEAREIAAQEVAAERDRWASRVDRLNAQLREVDARYMALLKAVADGRAMQPTTALVVSSWVCAKCGTDRLKAPCPLGHSAAADGRCPCVGVALGA